MSLGNKDLIELAKNVFSEKYNFDEGPVQIKGKSGKSCSITQLRQLHKACIDANFEGGIMVCNVITDFSREYSSQFGIQLLSRGHLISTLRRRRFQNDY